MGIQGKNVVWGIAWAAAAATLLSLYVLVLAIVQGSWAFEGYGVTGTTIIASYYIAALIVGAVIGICRPLLEWRLGAVVVGAFAGMCLYGSVYYVAEGEIDLVFAGAGGGSIGLVVGLFMWQHVQKHP